MKLVFPLLSLINLYKVQVLSNISFKLFLKGFLFFLIIMSFSHLSSGQEKCINILSTKPLLINSLINNKNYSKALVNQRKILKFSQELLFINFMPENLKSSDEAESQVLDRDIVEAEIKVQMDYLESKTIPLIGQTPYTIYELASNFTPQIIRKIEDSLGIKLKTSATDHVEKAFEKVLDQQDPHNRKLAFKDIANEAETIKTRDKFDLESIYQDDEIKPLPVNNSPDTQTFQRALKQYAITLNHIRNTLYIAFMRDRERIAPSPTPEVIESTIDKFLTKIDSRSLPLIGQRLNLSLKEIATNAKNIIPELESEFRFILTNETKDQAIYSLDPFISLGYRDRERLQIVDSIQDQANLVRDNAEGSSVSFDENTKPLTIRFTVSHGNFARALKQQDEGLKFINDVFITTFQRYNFEVLSKESKISSSMVEEQIIKSIQALRIKTKPEYGSVMIDTFSNLASSSLTIIGIIETNLGVKLYEDTKLEAVSLIKSLNEKNRGKLDRNMRQTKVKANEVLKAQRNTADIDSQNFDYDFFEKPLIEQIYIVNSDDNLTPLGVNSRVDRSNYEGALKLLLESTDHVENVLRIIFRKANFSPKDQFNILTSLKVKKEISTAVYSLIETLQPQIGSPLKESIQILILNSESLISELEIKLGLKLKSEARVKASELLADLIIGEKSKRKRALLRSEYEANILDIRGSL